MSVSAIDSLFRPRSVAVVGASRQPHRASYHVVKGLKEGGYAGRIYPVNPSVHELLGLPCYPDLLAIPDDVEMVFIAVPAEKVIDVIRACGVKGVKAAVVYSSGFSEAGQSGAKLESELSVAAREAGVRFIGPNCIGVADSRSKMTYFSDVPLEPGGVSLISHSGSLCGSIMRMGFERGARFSKAVSLGNQGDLGTCDFFEYLINDADTNVIAMYLETLRELPRFVHLAKRAMAAGKPVLVWKSGRTGSGSRAAATHTAALATPHALCEAAFRQGRVIACRGIEDLLDCMAMLQSGKTAHGPRLAIVSAPGGVAVAASDACDEAGLSLAEYSQTTTDRLSAFIPKFGSARNPVDLTTAVFFDMELYTRAIDAVQEDDGVDLTLVVAPAETRPEDFANLMRDNFPRWAKPIALSWTAPLDIYCSGLSVLAPVGIPVFPTPERAVSSLAILPRIRVGSAPDRACASAEPARDGSVPSGVVRFLDEAQAHAMLRASGFPVAESRVASSEHELRAALECVGFPVAMKVVSPDIPHKSDLGLVRLNVGSAKDAVSAFRSLLLRAEDQCPAARLAGILVQQMWPGDHELVVGASRSADGSATLMFGVGGILIEILRDVVFGVCPLDRNDAVDMVCSIRGAEIFRQSHRLRGKEPVDVGAVSDLIVAVSEFLETHPEVVELDLNPVMVRGNQIKIVDALMMVRADEEVRCDAHAR